MNFEPKGIQGAAPNVERTPGAGIDPPQSSEAPSFRRLLEQLEALKAAGSADQPVDSQAGLAGFAKAMRDVERDHATMQDLKERLLAAWRGRTS